ncbi:hypothetical protein L6R21_17445 [bacterium]|nr:hypothetical protein [bacterium]
MKRFACKLGLFAALIFLIDAGWSYLLDRGRPADYAAFVDSKREFDRLTQLDILFLGDSQTADGFVPAVFRERLGASAFNFGVYQLSPFEGYYLLRDLVDRLEQPPALVVLGTDAQMFRYRVADGKYAPLFITSPVNLIPLFFESSNLGALTEAGRKKYLFPGLLRWAVTGQVPGETRRQIQLVENGYLQNPKHYSDASQFDCDKDRGFFSETLVAQQTEFFHKTLAYLAERNIPCVIANLPMHPQFLAGMQAKPAYQEFQRELENMARTYRVPVFNRDHSLLLADFQDEDFLDGDHLCYAGARKFSAAFADYLEQTGFNFHSNQVAAVQPVSGAPLTERK